jgi:hypothetical protein
VFNSANTGVHSSTPDSIESAKAVHVIANEMSVYVFHSVIIFTRCPSQEHRFESTHLNPSIHSNPVVCYDF